jgi:hypothetical protein
MQEQDELWSALSRIRRGAEWPESALHEQKRNRKYPNEMRFPTKNATYILQYRKSRWHRMMMGEGCVIKRDLFCWLNFKNQQVGALHFVEFKPDPWINNDEFLFTMDADSYADMQIAEMLCDGWSEANDVLAYGPVLEFRFAWMAPQHATTAIWATAAEALIKAEFDDHSILVMQAFPLDYEGRAPDGSPAHVGLVRRQVAMIRYYRRLFGVDHFPGEWGADGWLWRANSRIADLLSRPVSAQ